jgi:hypothetical protein
MKSVVGNKYMTGEMKIATHLYFINNNRKRPPFDYVDADD